MFRRWSKFVCTHRIQVSERRKRDLRSGETERLKVRTRAIQLRGCLVRTTMQCRPAWMRCSALSGISRISKYVHSAGIVEIRSFMLSMQLESEQHAKFEWPSSRASTLVDDYCHKCEHASSQPIAKPKAVKYDSSTRITSASAGTINGMQ